LIHYKQADLYCYKDIVEANKKRAIYGVSVMGLERH